MLLSQIAFPCIFSCRKRIRNLKIMNHIGNKLKTKTPVYYFNSEIDIRIFSSTNLTMFIWITVNRINNFMLLYINYFPKRKLLTMLCSINKSKIEVKPK